MVQESGLKFFDAYTHPQFAAYADDQEEMIGRTIEAGVGMVAVGTQKDTSRTALELVGKYPGYIWAAVGLHPIHTSRSFHDAQELGSSFAAYSAEAASTAKAGKASEDKGGFWSRAEEFDYEYYKKLAFDPKTVAIGECGLDYFHVANNKEHIAKQKRAFEEQIKLAHEVGKPLMIHCRDAFGDLIEILNSKSSILNSPPGITHFFTGTKDDAKKLLNMGFYFTFGGVITFARDYDEIVRMVPLDKILSETDAPYLTPVPYRGRRNEPAYVVEVVKKLAELKGLSVEEMSEQIFANAKHIFGI